MRLIIIARGIDLIFQCRLGSSPREIILQPIKPAQRPKFKLIRNESYQAELDEEVEGVRDEPSAVILVASAVILVAFGEASAKDLTKYHH